MPTIPDSHNEHVPHPDGDIINPTVEMDDHDSELDPVTDDGDLYGPFDFTNSTLSPNSTTAPYPTTAADEESSGMSDTLKLSLIGGGLAAYVITGLVLLKKFDSYAPQNQFFSVLLKAGIQVVFMPVVVLECMLKCCCAIICADRPAGYHEVPMNEAREERVMWRSDAERRQYESYCGNGNFYRSS